MLINDVIYSIIIMTIACFLGVFIANLIFEFSLIQLISKPIIPIMKIANLPTILSIPTLISIIDIRGGLSIISSIKHKIDDSVVISYKLVTRPFSIIPLLIRNYLPISIISLGLFTGSFYIILIFISALISMIIGIIYGRLKIKKSYDLELISNNKEKRKIDTIKNSLNLAIDTTKKIIPKYVIIISIISLLISMGFFNTISDKLDIFIRQFGFSSSSTLLISIHTISPTSSILTAGELLKNGLISIKECLLALLIGRLLFIIVMDYPRHSFPFYVSFFPVKLAFKLVTIEIIINIIITPILMIIVYFLIP
ncbi:MAG: hypothetical protein NO483_06330 [Candidatus Methanomethylicia archaeon]|nr:hypothetical protein [Candidatus Methanomethylicia archaeon]